MLLEPSGKEFGLSVEVADGAVIPDNVIGLLGLYADSQLRGHYPLRELQRKPSLDI